MSGVGFEPTRAEPMRMLACFREDTSCLFDWDFVAWTSRLRPLGHPDMRKHRHEHIFIIYCYLFWIYINESNIKHVPSDVAKVHVRYCTCTSVLPYEGNTFEDTKVSIFESTFVLSKYFRTKVRCTFVPSKVHSYIQYVVQVRKYENISGSISVKHTVPS